MKRSASPGAQGGPRDGDGSSPHAETRVEASYDSTTDSASCCQQRQSRVAAGVRRAPANHPAGFVWRCNGALRGSNIFSFCAALTCRSQ